jgi:hypothetical protein
MQMTRNWQESFDRLERSRREEQRLREEEEERQVSLAEAAYARASLEVASAEKAAKAETGTFMLADDGAGQPPNQTDALVEPKSAAEPQVAKSQSTGLKTARRTAAKASPRKRAAPRRKAGAAKLRTAKPQAEKPKTSRPKTPDAIAAKPRVTRLKSAKPQTETPQLAESHDSESIAPPLVAESQPAISLPRASQVACAEPLLIMPLPHSTSLARYNKRGLFGLIGSWLRLAARRPRLPESLRRPARKDQAPRNDLAALKEENKQLRRELEALRAKQAETPPWDTLPAGLTTPTGDVPARPRRRGGILR